MSCRVGHRRDSDPVWLWLWHRPAAAALIRPLVWESPHASGTALKSKKKKKVFGGLLSSTGVGWRVLEQAGLAWSCVATPVCVVLEESIGEWTSKVTPRSTCHHPGHIFAGLYFFKSFILEIDNKGSQTVLSTCQHVSLSAMAQ